MDLDTITDIEILRNLCKKSMIQMAKTIETPTHIYKEGEWYFFTQDMDGVFLWLDDPTLGLFLNYDEACEYIRGE